MSVIAPCDPAETEAATRWCAGQERGPVYLRLGKAGEPDFTRDAAEPWEFGKVRLIRPGAEVAILCYGPIMKQAFAVADRLAARGTKAALYSVHTIKPLDRDGIARILGSYARVVVIEECAPNGSLSMNIQSIAWQQRAGCALDVFTLKDEFIHCYGSHDDLLAAHGLTVDGILAGITA
jgi:transketolase